MPNEDELLQVKKRIREILPYGAVKSNLDMIIDMVKPIIEKQNDIYWIEITKKSMEDAVRQERERIKNLIAHRGLRAFMDEVGLK